MSKRRLFFHSFLLLASVIVGGLSIWESGLIPEGKNHPNFIAIAMVLMVIGQIAQLMAFKRQKKDDPESL